MLRHFARRFRTVSVVVRPVAVLSILLSLVVVVQAQQTDISKPSATPVWPSVGRNGLQLALPDTSDTQVVSAPRRSARESSVASAYANNPLLLPAVLYGSGGYQVTAVAVADVNLDGIPDLLVTNGCVASDNCNEGSVSVLLGNGDGTFKAAVSYVSGAYFTEAVAVGDVNSDGKPDLILYSTAPYGDTYGDAVISVLLGKGDGTFQSAVLYDAGGVAYDSRTWGAKAVVVTDLNGDGKLDIAAANYGNGNIYDENVGVLIGNGDGTFQPAVGYNFYQVFGISSHTTGIAVADVNGDGIPDLVAGTDPLAILLGKGDGTFYPGNSYSLSSPVVAPAVADVNGDGIPDLLAGASGNSMSVLLGTGGGNFLLKGSFDVAGVQSITVADLNGDGVPDLVMGAGDDVITLYGHGDGTFQDPLGYYLFGTGSAAVADLNNDDKLDVIATNSVDGGDAVAVFLNNRQGPPYTATTTTLTSSADPTHTKQTVTYTATINRQSGGAVTGTVAFQQTNSATKFSLTIGVAPVFGNQASLSVSYLKTDSIYLVSAAYSGDAINSYSTSNVLREAISNFPISTSTRLSSSAHYSITGRAVTFVAKIYSAIGSVPDGGPVTFFDGTNPIGATTTAGGVASFTTAGLAAGTHDIQASYLGNSSFKSSSGKVSEVVAAPPVVTETKLSTSGSPSLVGQAVTFTARVTSRYGAIPDGEVVTFGDGSTTMGTGTTTGGVATFTTSSLKARTHTIRGTYAGDGTFQTSWGAVAQVVEESATQGVQP
jgi:Bacterial Ig-like domain (group 3)/FG-GAP-like repeat